MKPIITSFLDQDFYKFTMGQFILEYYEGTPVTFSFKCRTKTDKPITKMVKEEDLRRELDNILVTNPTVDELVYLGSLYLFNKKYLNFLKDIANKMSKYELEYKGDELSLTFSGPWETVTYWETLSLSIVSELYYRNYNEGRAHMQKDILETLMPKIEVLRANPGIKIVEFGTRRRYSKHVQSIVTGMLNSQLGAKENLLGTSNTRQAMQHRIKAIGTMAHELFMVSAGAAYDGPEWVRQSQRDVCDRWLSMYGDKLAILLPDTFGSDWFFTQMDRDDLLAWNGFRQDSGDPVEFGEKVIKLYQENDIDPRTRSIIFSDGLDIGLIIKLYDHFAKRINVAFGWGTNLTNDIGAPPLSLVVKATEACGQGLVKLSDNPAKSIGISENIEAYKKAFNYGENHERKECVY